MSPGSRYPAAMGRWAPGAESRLRDAALELFTERGYEATTVADIAERAGLTARTFFRYFADKREVLFGGSAALLDAVTRAARTAPADATPLQTVAAALDAFATTVGQDHAWSRRRRAVIDANPELLERELVKLATMAQQLADVLRGRGVPDPDAALVAEAGLGVLRVAFDQWTAADDAPPLATIMQTALGRLRSAVG